MRKIYLFIIGILFSINIFSVEVIDTIIAKQLNATSDSYVTFDSLTLNSQAMYCGNTSTNTKQQDYINIKTSKAGSLHTGIVSNISGGLLKSIKIGIREEGKTIDVYAKNEPYSSQEDLWGETGTKVFSATLANNEFDFENKEYTYVGLRSASGSGTVQIDTIFITWEYTEYNNSDKITGTKLGTDNTYSNWTFETQCANYIGCTRSQSGAIGDVWIAGSKTTKGKYPGIIANSEVACIRSITFNGVTCDSSTNFSIFTKITQFDSIREIHDSRRGKVNINSDTTIYFNDKFTRYVAIRAYGNTAICGSITFNWEPITHRRSVTNGNIGTICLEQGVDSGYYKGATFYEVTYLTWQNQLPYKIYFDEVKTLEAGVPYVFQADSSEMIVIGSGDKVDSPIDKNGLHGTFVNIIDSLQETPVLEGNYLIHNNQFTLCGKYCALAAYRAYLVVDEVSITPQSQTPGRKRIVLGGSDIPTNVNIYREVSTPKKIFMNGKLFIVLNNQTYDIYGQKVKGE